MNVVEFTHIVRNPELLEKPEQTKYLEELLEHYPYFQTLHALYIKGLKSQSSHKYNQAIKRAAAHSADRRILFDFITSDVFNDITTEQSTKEDLKETPKEEHQVADHAMTSNAAPFDFDKNEIHSFSTWLELTNARPISEKKPIEKRDEKRAKKSAQIEAFLQQKPKIIPQKDFQPTIDITQRSHVDEGEIMTETLARIYWEQKKYTKAIQAYTILSLKYPEKNSFFAGQIKAIKKSQKEK